MKIWFLSGVRWAILGMMWSVERVEEARVEEETKPGRPDMEPRDRPEVSKVTQHIARRDRAGRGPILSAAAQGSSLPRPPPPLHQAPHQQSGQPESPQASPQTPSEAFMKTWREQLCDYSLNFALIQHSSPLRHD